MLAHNNFLRNLPVLNDAEQKELVRQLSHPIVIKYFNLVVLTAVADLALTDAITSASNTPALIAHQAFVKGNISVIDTILSNLNLAKE